MSFVDGVFIVAAGGFVRFLLAAGSRDLSPALAAVSDILAVKHGYEH